MTDVAVDTKDAAGAVSFASANQSLAEPQADAVAVAYCHTNEVAYSWHFSMLQMLVVDLANNGRIRRGGMIAMRCNAGQLVSARNKAIKHFLDSDAPWLLWIDTDMGFDSDTLEQLIAAADPIQRPIVGALCFGQQELGSDGKGGYHTLATPTIFDWTDGLGPDGLEGFEIRYDYPANALIRCGGTGAACILVHRKVFEDMQAKYGDEWYNRIAAKDGSMGEDLSFCMRATALGFPIHVHTGVRTTHLKPIWLAETNFLERISAPPATSEVAVVVPVLGRPEHAAPFMASLRASTGLARVYAVCQSDDQDTAAAWLAAGAEVLESGEQTSFAAKANLGYAKTTQPWMLLVGSDVHFHPGWLDQALAAVTSDQIHVVGTNDLGNPRVLAGEHATHMLIRRSYIDEQGASWDGPGVVAHEGYRHWFVDDEIVTAAKQRGVWTPALGSKVEHLHPAWGKAEPDKTYELGQAHVEADHALFESRRVKFGGPRGGRRMPMFLPWRPVLLTDGPVPAISTSVTHPETKELQRLASQPDVHRILEVGSAFGYSAIAMALANPDAHVDAVDPHTELGSHPVAGGSREVMAGNLAAYGVADRVTMLVEPSQQALPQLEPGSYDLVFVDADHREPAVIHDVTWALKLLRPGGVLACHDLDEGTCPGVRAALDRLFDHPEPTVDTLFVHRT